MLRVTSAEKFPFGVRAILIGAGSALVGLLPWILTGLRLPVQNLWATDVALPAQMPVAFLPFSQYEVAFMVSMLLVGGGLAGIVFRAWRVPRRRSTVLLLLAGVLVIDLVAIIQSAVVTGAGLREPTGFVATLVTPEQVYLVGIVTIAVIGMLLALTACVFVAAVPAPGPMIGVALAASTLTSWATAFVVPPISVPANGVAGLLAALRYLPGLAVGVAVGLLWSRSLARSLVGGILAFALAWLGPTLITTMSGALGSRVLLTQPQELAAFGGLLFRTVALSWDVWGGILLGAVVAIVLIVVRAVVKGFSGDTFRPDVDEPAQDAQRPENVVATPPRLK